MRCVSVSRATAGTPHGTHKYRLHRAHVWGKSSDSGTEGGAAADADARRARGKSDRIDRFSQRIKCAVDLLTYKKWVRERKTRSKLLGEMVFIHCISSSLTRHKRSYFNFESQTARLGGGIIITTAPYAAQGSARAPHQEAPRAGLTPTPGTPIASESSSVELISYQ